MGNPTSGDLIQVETSGLRCSLMLGMYRDRRKNIAILGAAAVLFALGLACSQLASGDVAYMKR